MKIQSINIYGLSQQDFDISFVTNFAKSLEKPFFLALKNNPNKQGIINYIKEEGSDTFLKMVLNGMNKVIMPVLTNENLDKLAAEGSEEDSVSMNENTSEGGVGETQSAYGAGNHQSAADTKENQLVEGELSSLYTQVDKYVTAVVAVLATILPSVKDISDGSVNGKKINSNLIQFSQSLITWITQVNDYAKSMNKNYKGLSSFKEQFPFLENLYQEFKEYLKYIIEAGDEVYKRILNENIKVENSSEVKSAQTLEAAVDTEINKLNSDETAVELG